MILFTENFIKYLVIKTISIILPIIITISMLFVSKLDHHKIPEMLKYKTLIIVIVDNGC